MDLKEEIFRAYDIRGIVNEGFDSEVVYLLGRAIGTLLIRQGHREMITGRDARTSSPTLIEELWRGLLSTGIDVIDIGQVPTPLVYYATHVLSASSGLMLTASHNPPNYNGLKIIVERQCLSEGKIKAIYHQILKNDFIDGAGKLRHENVINHYIARVTSDIKLSKRMKVVIDCGNAIPAILAPALFDNLGCDLILLHDTLDGNFPNHQPDPSVETNLKDLQATVLREQADLGIAFDGDGDRLGVVTDKGDIIFPDRLMMLYAQDVLSRKPGANLLFDVKCTRLLPDYIKELEGSPMMWKTGHSFMKQKMLEVNAELAGEMSGHIFFKDRWFGFDDGIYSAARLLEIAANREEKLSAIFSRFPQYCNTPEIKITLAEEDKFPFIEKFKQQAKFENGVLTLIDGIRVDFSDGWGLVRASNTSPALTLRFEAKDMQSLQVIQELFRKQMLSLDPSLQIAF